MEDFKKSTITADQQKMIGRHLKFIEYISLASIKYGYRTIISGGYAVDGAVGKITRPHNDIDIQIYGKAVVNDVLLTTNILAKKYENLIFDDVGEEYFYHKYVVRGIGAKINYLRVATNPFSESKIVITADGKYTEEHEFETKTVILQGVRFEAQSPVLELAGKMYKREYRGDRRLLKHDQDIHNLRRITNNYDVQTEIEKMKKRNTHAFIF